MLRRTFIQLPAALAAQTAALPEFYKSVAALVWVVGDAVATAAQWEKLGIPVGESPMRMPLPDATLRGKPASTTMTVQSGNLGHDRPLAPVRKRQ